VASNNTPAPGQVSTLVLVCSVLLCLVNAALWTLYSDMPIAGAGWVLAAGACIALRRWSIW
jgi:hypothetical protein